MHNRAYADHETDLICYQPLRSEQRAVYSRPERGLTPVQMREAGKTRRAAQHGKTVAFMRLSPTCKVTPVWLTVWHEEYASENEAALAATTWETRVRIERPGFMTGQA